MPPRRKMLDDVPEAAPAPAAPQARLPIPEVPTAQRHSGKTRKTYTVTARPHVSLYISEAVQKAVKLAAIERDLKPHDVYLAGLRMILSEYGVHDFDALNAQKPEGTAG